MNIGERRYRAHRKMMRRKRLMDEFGQRGGTVYEKHIEKVNKSLGYMKDHGNITHYVNVGFGEKTRDRNRYGKVKRLKHSELKRLTKGLYEDSEID